MTGNCILCVDADNVMMMMMMMMQWRNLLSFTRNKLRLLLHVLTLNTTYTFLVLSPCSSRNTNTHVGLLIQRIKNERALSALARAKRAHLWRRWRGKKSLQHVIDDEGYEESSKKARERDHISFKNMPYIIVNDFERDPNLLNYLMGCDVCTKSEWVSGWGLKL